MADHRIRQLTIKTGIVKRLAKETVSHEKEADLQRKRIENVKNAGGDEHVIKKQEEVLTECLMMIPDCRKRLGIAIEDLNEFLNSQTDLEQFDQYVAAKVIIDEAKLQLI